MWRYSLRSRITLIFVPCFKFSQCWLCYFKTELFFIPNCYPSCSDIYSFLLYKVLGHGMDCVNGFLCFAVNKALCTYSSVLHFLCSYTILCRRQVPRHTCQWVNFASYLYFIPNSTVITSVHNCISQLSVKVVRMKVLLNLYDPRPFNLIELCKLSITTPFYIEDRFV